MSPTKPWEKSFAPQRDAQQGVGFGVLGSNSFIGGSGDFANTAGVGNSSNLPPPLPPRPVGAAGANSYNGYNTGYGNYGGNYGATTNPYFYGGGGGTSSYYGGYNNYNNYNNRLPYYGGGTGGMGNEPGDFVRLAEEQSRNAFQSIESIVQAFSSVSMMLDSTLNAIYSSFRAVLGVADQFTRLKLQLSQILTSLAVIRFIRWMWRRFLIFIRLRPTGASSDELWRQIMNGDTTSTAAQILSSHVAAGKSVSHWPTLIFFAFVIGGPYVIWKLVSKLVATVEDQKRWATGEVSHFIAVALYDFEAGSSGELSIRAGQRLRLAPKELQPSVRGWILGSTDGKAIGLVPANYIKIMGKQSVDEISSTQQPPTANVESAPNSKSMANMSNNDLEKLFDESNSK